MRISRDELARGVEWLHRNSGFWTTPRLSGEYEWSEDDLGNSREAEELYLIEVLEACGVGVEPR